MHSYQFDLRTVRQVNSLDAAVRIRSIWLLWYLRQAGLHPQVIEGRRSARRQAALFSQGRTAPGAIVTSTLRSRHISGRAFDIGFKGMAPAAVPQSWWNYAGAVGEWLGLVWGGRWALRDFAHFEAKL